MGTELTTTEGRALSTPEGARALRLTVSSVCWGETDLAEARRLLSADVIAALPAARTELAARLAPATRGDFKRTVAPTLALVAPAGMSEDDQTAWLATAVETLRGIPADLLEQACARVRRKADHPSKIVAGIFAEIGRAWDDRKEDWRRLERLEAVAAERAAPTAQQQIAEEIPVEEIRGWTPMFCRMALKQGWVTQAQLDAAGAVIEAEKPASAPAAPAGKPRMPTAAELAAVSGVGVEEARRALVEGMEGVRRAGETDRIAAEFGEGWREEAETTSERRAA